MTHKLISNKNNINIVIHNNLAKQAVHHKSKKRESSNGQSSMEQQYIQTPTYLNRFVGLPNPRIEQSFDSVDNRIRNNNPVSTSLGSDAFHTIGDPTPSEVYSEPFINNQNLSPNPKDIYLDNENELLSPEIQRYIEQGLRNAKSIKYSENNHIPQTPFNLLAPSNLFSSSPNSSLLSGGGVSKFADDNESGYESALSNIPRRREKKQLIVADKNDDKISDDATSVQQDTSLPQPKKERAKNRSKEQIAIDNAKKEEARKEKNALRLAKAQEELQNARTENQRQKALDKIESIKNKN